MDFEADPNNKFKPLIKRLIFSLSKSSEFPSITQLKYCRKLEFEVESKLCLCFLRIQHLERQNPKKKIRSKWLWFGQSPWNSLYILHVCNCKQLSAYGMHTYIHSFLKCVTNTCLFGPWVASLSAATWFHKPFHYHHWPRHVLSVKFTGTF